MTNKYNVENEIGLFVRMIREAKGYNQEEICEGICSLATLSRIETGERTVDFLMVESLLARMKVEKSEYEFILDEEEYELYQQREEIISLIQRQQYDKAKRKLLYYEKHYGKEVLHQQFVFWQRAWLLQKEGLKSKVQLKEVFLKAIVITAPKYEQKFKQREILSNIELSCITGIFSCIENSVEKEEKFEELYKYFQWCKIKEKLYPVPYRMAMQYYAECLYENKKYELCKKICIEAIQELSLTSKLENREKFFYLKAKAQEKIGFLLEVEKQQCMNDFLTAYYIREFYNGEEDAKEVEMYIKERCLWQFIE